MPFNTFRYHSCCDSWTTGRKFYSCGAALHKLSFVSASFKFIHTIWICSFLSKFISYIHNTHTIEVVLYIFFICYLLSFCYALSLTWNFLFWRNAQYLPHKIYSETYKLLLYPPSSLSLQTWVIPWLLAFPCSLVPFFLPEASSAN